MARIRSRSLVLALPVSLLALNVACTSGDNLVTAKGAALYQAADCGDLLSQIQADALAKLDQQTKMFQDSAQDGYFGGGYYGRGGKGEILIDSPNVDMGASAGGNVSGADGAETPAAPPSSHSETNTQVVGVDEADIVKNDGERIYLLHGTDFYILDSWPADETKILGHTAVEGSGYELFVDGGKATLFSTVYPTDVDAGSQPTKPAVDPGFAPDCMDCYGGTPFTKISVFDVTGDSPALEREFLFEGNYVSARRHGDVVRTIVQGGFHGYDLYNPTIETYDGFGNPLSAARIRDALGVWRDSRALDIKNSTLENWVPRRFERKDGILTELSPGCSEYYIPEPGRVQDGVSQVVTLDIQGTTTPKVTSILGGSQTVYANTSKLILAQTDWSYNFQAINSTRSALHQFVLDGATTKYDVSGFVPGYLINQFAIDERRDVIRVTTSEDIMTDPTSWSVETQNRVYQLGATEGKLAVLSKSEPLGAAGERIMSTRFVGDRAYVVTYLQTDPLLVVDVTKGDKTTLLGELKIPGFSEYMHPVDGTHLLTIGQDGDANGTNGGIALQIFDVTKPTAPALTFKETFANSWSEASYNHKAFTFVANYFAEDVGLLLFPISSYDPVFKSTLAVVKVDTNGGFTKLGMIDHTALLTAGCAEEMAVYGYCYSYYGQEMRRGLQIDNFIYAISYGGLTVQSLDDLATPSVTVPLPQPVMWSYGYGMAVDGGTTGSGVAPTPTGTGGASSIEPTPAGGTTSTGGTSTGGSTSAP